MYTITVPNKDGSIEVYFKELNYWEEFEVILELLEKENGCKVLSEQDIGDSREAALKLNNFEFLLRHHYMFGNFLYTTQPADAPILEKLANSVIGSIKTKLSNQQQ